MVSLGSPRFGLKAVGNTALRFVYQVPSGEEKEKEVGHVPATLWELEEGDYGYYKAMANDWSHYLEKNLSLPSVTHRWSEWLQKGEWLIRRLFKGKANANYHRRLWHNLAGLAPIDDECIQMEIDDPEEDTHYLLSVANKVVGYMSVHNFSYTDQPAIDIVFTTIAPWNRNHHKALPGKFTDVLEKFVSVVLQHYPNHALTWAAASEPGEEEGKVYNRLLKKYGVQAYMVADSELSAEGTAELQRIAQCLDTQTRDLPNMSDTAQEVLHQALGEKFTLRQWA